MTPLRSLFAAFLFALAVYPAAGQELASTRCRESEVVIDATHNAAKLDGCGDTTAANLLWHLDRIDQRDGLLDGQYRRHDTGHGAVTRFIKVALAGQPPVIDGDGLDERDYIHVADAAEATLAALRHRANGTYNIGTSIGTKTLDLARLVTKLADAKATPVCRTWTRPEQARTRIVCDTELAGAHLGFTAHRVLVDGITEEIGWLRAQLAGAPEMALAASA